MPDVPVPQNFDIAAAQGRAMSAKEMALRAMAAGGSEALKTAAANQAQMAANVDTAALSAAANAGSIPGGAGAFAQEQANTAAQGFQPLQMAANLQSQGAQTYAGLLGQANENYGNQVSQAIPLVQAQAGRELQGLHAKATENKRDRDQARQLAELQMRNSREDRAASAAQNAINLERSKIGLESDKLSIQKQREAQAEAANGPALTDNDYRAIKVQIDKATQDYGSAFAPALARLSKSDTTEDDKGNITVAKNRGYQAVEAMIDRGLTAKQAAEEFRSPSSGKPLSEAAIQSWYDEYQRGLALQLGQSPDYYRYQDYVSKQQGAPRPSMGRLAAN